MSSKVRLAVAFSAVLLSAAVYTLCFPPYDLRTLATVALVPLLIAARKQTPSRAAGLGALWGFASAWGITYWLPTTVSVYYHQPYWLGLLLFTAATAAMVAFEYALAVAAYAWAAARLQRSLPFFAAGAWVAAEFTRTQLLTGNPWGFLGYSQAVLAREVSGLDALALALAQVADIGGVYAVTFVLVAVNAAIADAVCLRDRPSTGVSAGVSARVSVVLPALTLLLVTTGYGGYRLATLEEAQTAGRPRATRVAIVQPNLDLGSQWREDLYGQNLVEILEMTADVLGAKAGARAEQTIPLVVWPENAMTFFVAEEPLYRAAIARLLIDFDATLIAGAPHVERGESGNHEYFNSAFVLAPDGSVAGRYDKTHLLPFAEYFPLSTVALLNRSFGRVRQFSAASDRPVLETPAGRVGTLICNETMFGSLARKRVLAGAELLVMLSNDSWVGDPMYGRHQLQMAIMRAIEQRRSVVRSSTSGPSAIIDQRGCIETMSQPNTEATLRGTVRAGTHTSIYTRIGDAFAWASLLTVILVVVVVRRRESNVGL